MELLSVKNCTKRFHSISALDDFSFSVNRGDIHGLIGPNGAGKTTLVSCITGLIGHIDSGEIYFDGHDLTKLHPYEIINTGLTRTFQVTQLIPGLDVVENVAVGIKENDAVRRGGIRKGFSLLFGHPDRQKARDICNRFGIEDILDSGINAATHYQQKLITLARAVVSDPQMVILDEPTAGMSFQESSRFGEIIQSLNTENRITFLIIEHNIPFIFQHATYMTVLNQGKHFISGNPEEIRGNESVKEIYIGNSIE